MRSQNRKPVQRVAELPIQQEMHFRHSLLKLMTSPHYSGVAINPVESERSVEEAMKLERLALVPVRRAVPGTRAAS